MDSGSPTTAHTSTFHSDDVESLADYRSLSVLALVSLVIGLMAPLAFAAPLAWAIPLIGIGVSLIALRRIAVSEGLLAGRWAATMGLALSIASILAVLSYDQVVKVLYLREAEAFAQSWLAALQAGDTERAFRLTTEGADPPPPPNEAAAGPQVIKPYDRFLATPTVQRITQSGPGEVRLANTREFDRRGHGQSLIAQTYTITPTSRGPNAPATPAPLQVDLSLQRGRLHGEPWPRWLVVTFQSPGEAPAQIPDPHHGHHH